MGKQVDGGFDKWRASLPARLQGTSDYDLRGYYNKYGAQPVTGNMHLTDEFKLPNHVTFSNESRYSNSKTPGGQWAQVNGQWQFKPSQYNIDNVGTDSLKNYFSQNEPDSKLILPTTNPIAFPARQVMQQDNTKMTKMKKMANGGIMAAATKFRTVKQAKYRRMDGGGPTDLYSDDQDPQVMAALKAKKLAMQDPNAGNLVDKDGNAMKFPSGKSGSGLSTSAVTAIGGLGESAINAIDPKDKYGVQSNAGAIGSGALKGAEAGAVLGPIGMGVGALVGATASFIGNKKAMKAKTASIIQQGEQEQTMREQRSGAMIAANPALKYGNRDASYFAMGGTMKGTIPGKPRLIKPAAPAFPKPRVMPNIADVPGRQLSRMARGGSLSSNGSLPSGGTTDRQMAKNPNYNLTKLYKPYRPFRTAPPRMMAEGGGIHINPANKGKFNATKAATGKSTEELTHSSNSVTKKRAVFAQNAAKWHHGADGGTFTAIRNKNGGQDFKTSDPSYKYPWLVMGANGGQVQRLSSEDTKVEGPSHANGGVKFPSAGVELEGGETMNDDFVFSKKLGFAQKHEAIAKAMGKIEKKPDTVVNRNTAKALDRQTDMLKLQQEAMKKQLGIPNEIDMQAAQMQQQQQGGQAIPSTGNQLAMGGKAKPKYSHEMLHMEDTNPTKMAVGGIPPGDPPIGGPGSKTKTPPPSVTLSTGPIGFPKPGDPYWKAHPLMTESPTHPYGPWGYDIPKPDLRTLKQKLGNAASDEPLSSVTPTPIVNGTGDAANPAMIQQRKGPVVKSIPGNTSGMYKMGGKMKKMADGGPGTISPEEWGKFTNPWLNNPKYSLPSRSDVPPTLSATDEAALNVPAFPTAPTPAQGKADNGAAAQSSTGSGSTNDKKGTISKINDAAEKISPFISNIYNATQKLPLPNKPALESPTTPNTVDFSASRAEAVRQTRAANKSAEENLNSGAAVAATRAENLASQQRAVGQSYEAENTTNAQIRNQTNAENMGVAMRNNGLMNKYREDLTSRQLKTQEMHSANIANVEEKIQGMRRDASAKDLDEHKLMLTALQDTTGASYRSARNVFSKYLSKEDMASLDATAQQRMDDAKADRKMGLSGMASAYKLYKAGKLSPTDFADLVGNGISTVAGPKDRKTEESTK